MSIATVIRWSKNAAVGNTQVKHNEVALIIYTTECLDLLYNPDIPDMKHRSMIYQYNYSAVVVLLFPSFCSLASPSSSSSLGLVLDLTLFYSHLVVRSRNCISHYALLLRHSLQDKAQVCGTPLSSSSQTQSNNMTSMLGC